MQSWHPLFCPPYLHCIKYSSQLISHLSSALDQRNLRTASQGSEPTNSHSQEQLFAHECPLLVEFLKQSAQCSLANKLQCEQSSISKVTMGQKQTNKQTKVAIRIVLQVFLWTPETNSTFYEVKCRPQTMFPFLSIKGLSQQPALGYVRSLCYFWQFRVHSDVKRPEDTGLKSTRCFCWELGFRSQMIHNYLFVLQFQRHQYPLSSLYIQVGNTHLHKISLKKLLLSPSPPPSSNFMWMGVFWCLSMHHLHAQCPQKPEGIEALELPADHGVTRGTHISYTLCALLELLNIYIFSDSKLN